MVHRQPPQRLPLLIMLHLAPPQPHHSLNQPSVHSLQWCHGRPATLTSLCSHACCMWREFLQCRVAYDTPPSIFHPSPPQPRVYNCACTTVHAHARARAHTHTHAHTRHSPPCAAMSAPSLKSFPNAGPAIGVNPMTAKGRRAHGHPMEAIHLIESRPMALRARRVICKRQVGPSRVLPQHICTSACGLKKAGECGDAWHLLPYYQGSLAPPTTTQSTPSPSSITHSPALLPALFGPCSHPRWLQVREAHGVGVHGCGGLLSSQGACSRRRHARKAAAPAPGEMLRCLALFAAVLLVVALGDARVQWACRAVGVYRRHGACYRWPSSVLAPDQSQRSNKG